MAKRILLLLTCLLLVGGCAGKPPKPAPPPAPPPAVSKPAPSPPPPAPEAAKPPAAPLPALVRVPAEELPPFEDDMDLASLEAAMDKSLSYLNRAAGSGPKRMDDRVVTVQELKESLAALREILRRDDPQEVKQALIRDTFDVFKSTGSDGKGRVLYTGYFEPIMKGALKRSERYRYPIYRVPDDAVYVNLGKFGEKYQYDQIVGRVKNGELIPYYSRSEIEELGALAGRKLEIAWVDDRIGLFFLHTQGSGKIQLPNGRLLQIGYALKNGRPFQSLGRYLVETGRITAGQLSYQSIKRYLREHPGELSEILGHNESFIFFREVAAGPVGSLGEILTGGRSIATDPALFPRGGPAFIQLRKPRFDQEGNVTGWTPFTRFVLNQDTGGVIKGAGRVDLFCGSGDEAERLAGSLSERGSLYFLVKKRTADQGPQR
jgi:membrane-bound lytic murein transglycosylase A